MHNRGFAVSKGRYSETPADNRCREPRLTVTKRMAEPTMADASVALTAELKAYVCFE